MHDADKGSRGAVRGRGTFPYHPKRAAMPPPTLPLSPLALSPLAPAAFPPLRPIAGVRLASAACGLRYRDRDDVMLAAMPEGTRVAGAFTRSETAAAPVLWCRDALTGGRARGLVVNAGIANAFTGSAGADTVRGTAGAAAALFDCPSSEVFVASTGVIGETLETDKILAAMPRLHDGLAADAWEAAARAIMTTDTYPKGASRQVAVGGVSVTINGIAKGSGMIAPDMETMLAFLFTDAALPGAVLQDFLSRAVARSFNAITVDGDTSTSDTVLLFATGTAPAFPAEAGLARFEEAVYAVCADLAWQIVGDGEGAQKRVTISVRGAESDAAARRIALSIANSLLVKTALAGADPNWGRIVMAVGKCGERVAPEHLSIKIGGVLVAEAGAATTPRPAAATLAHLRGREIALEVDVGVGVGESVAWTCDLTKDYIDINTRYRS